MASKTTHYSGHVQGVGFRFTAQRVAAGYDVVGYVRNLPDGRVELWAQGTEAQVSRFLAEVARRMRENITGIEMRDCDPDTGLTAFDIRR